MTTLWIDKLGGRKFIVAASTGFLTCMLVWFGKIADGIFATVILGTVGAYIVGNVAQQKVAADAEKRS